MTMIRQLSALGMAGFVFLVAAAPSARASHPKGTWPKTADHPAQPQADFRAFMKLGPANAMLETTSRREPWNANYHSVRVGGYYSLARGVKAGMFYKRQWGARHDDDWIVTGDAATARAKWAPTAERGEDIFMLDLTPRAELGFMPGGPWVTELKARYEANLLNGQQTIKLRPGLTYFWFGPEKPVATLFARYELYLPLNYGVSSIYERWLYLGGLYHLNDVFQVGPFLAHRAITWGTSESFKRLFPDEGYETTLGWWQAGVTVSLRFDAFGVAH